MGFIKIQSLVIFYEHLILCMKICVTEKGVIHSGQNWLFNLINYMKAVSVGHDFTGYCRTVLWAVSIKKTLKLIPIILSL